MNYDIRYMRHALQLAAQGRGETSPNPMVGAVIVHDDRIIGQGYHRRCGEGHAEVNAVNSVADQSLLPESTIYVTLEPCSHYGKTPPCAKLLIDKGIKRVVVGAVDPFEKVAGRGIGMLRESGAEVVTEVLGDESRLINKRFFTAHTQRRPFVTLKWAQSADGFMDRRRASGEKAYRFSTDETSMLVHRLRSLHDAVLTTATTVNADDSRLDTRLWPGRNARPVILVRDTQLLDDRAILKRDPLIVDGHRPLDDILKKLYADGITSALVEAGPTLLREFIDRDLWDEARIEVAPVRLGADGTHPAPVLNHAGDVKQVGENTIITVAR